MDGSVPEGPTDVAAELDRLRHSPKGRPEWTGLVSPGLELADGPSFVPQYEAIFVDGVYDFPHAGSAPTIVDGGANIGLALLWWRSRWPEARILAFEPDPKLFKFLQCNTRHLRGLELFRCALTATGADGVFVSEGTDAGRMVGTTADAAIGEVIEVPSVTLSSVLGDLDIVDLLKLDIEGSETAVLEESEESLDKVERVFVEYHSFFEREQELGRLVSLLERSGFRYTVETPVRARRPFHGVPGDRGIDFQCEISAWKP